MVPPLLLDRSCCSEDVAGGDTEEWGGGGGGTMGNTVLPAAAAAASALATAAATAARRALKNCNSAKFALLANLQSERREGENQIKILCYTHRKAILAFSLVWNPFFFAVMEVVRRRVSETTVLSEQDMSKTK